MEKKVIYFIYPDVHEVAAHTIKEDLKNTIHIITNPDYDRLKSYLTNDPKAICVLLISDNFLRSMPCMSQAVSFMQAGDYDSMVSIILDSQRLKAGRMNEYENYPTNINSNEDSIRHRDFWWDELIRLRKASNKAQGAEQLALEHKKKLAQKISTRMSLFIDKVKTFNPLTWDAFRADNYQILFDKLGLGHTSPEERFGFQLPSYETTTVEEDLTTAESVETPNIPVEPEVQLVEPISTEDLTTEEDNSTEIENPVNEVVTIKEESSTDIEDTVIEIKTEDIQEEPSEEIEMEKEEVSSPQDNEATEEKILDKNSIEEGIEISSSEHSEEKSFKIEEQIIPEDEVIREEVVDIEELVIDNTEEDNTKEAEKTEIELSEKPTLVEEIEEEVITEEIKNEEKEETIPESNPTEETTIMEENENKEKEFIIKSLESLEDIDEQALVEQLGLLETEDLDVLFHVAETKMEEDDFEDARFLYEKILQIDPFNGRALIWLARLLNNHFDDEKSNAEAIYRKAIAFNEPNAQLNYEYGLLARDHFQSAHKAAELF
ncbi:MAG: hypothetical protein MK212_11830, partial [Saprospiraceae bacterium]|nr:hypothetical protein [Saprospiraceae bacterium]